MQGEKTNHQALTASCLLFVFEIVHSTQQRCYLCFGTSKRITAMVSKESSCNIHVKIILSHFVGKSFGVYLG